MGVSFLMNALDFFKSGRFDKAIEAYQVRLADNPEDHPAASGLAHSLMGAGLYQDALPWEWRVHEREKRKIPDGPGEHLNLSCAYWCLGDRAHAMELVRGLCAGIMDRSINMAPDQAGGATYGLVLHYMALFAGDREKQEYALNCLQKLNEKYDKRPTLFRYPVQTVKQLLGEVTFEDALEGATKERNLAAARQVAEGNRSVKLALGVVLFHDGVLHRVRGDEAGCVDRMKQVFDLGYQTETTRWYLARHEVSVSA